MPKQRLEGVLSGSIKKDKNLYGFKLHNNPLTHQTSPADFLVHSKSGFTYYIECKECKLVDERGAFGFDRLTQENDLKLLNSFNNNVKCFVMILFRGMNLKKSYCFLIPFEQYIIFKTSFSKKSANLQDFKKYLSDYLIIPEVGSIYKLTILK